MIETSFRALVFQVPYPLTKSASDFSTLFQCTRVFQNELHQNLYLCCPPSSWTRGASPLQYIEDSKMLQAGCYLLLLTLHQLFPIMATFFLHILSCLIPTCATTVFLKAGPQKTVNIGRFHIQWDKEYNTRCQVRRLCHVGNRNWTQVLWKRSDLNHWATSPAQSPDFDNR